MSTCPMSTDDTLGLMSPNPATDDNPEIVAGPNAPSVAPINVTPGQFSCCVSCNACLYIRQLR